jgi:hypothetical protein
MAQQKVIGWAPLRRKRATGFMTDRCDGLSGGRQLQAVRVFCQPTGQGARFGQNIWVDIDRNDRIGTVEPIDQRTRNGARTAPDLQHRFSGRSHRTCTRRRGRVRGQSGEAKFRHDQQATMSWMPCPNLTGAR